MFQNFVPFSLTGTRGIISNWTGNRRHKRWCSFPLSRWTEHLPKSCWVEHRQRHGFPTTNRNIKSNYFHGLIHISMLGILWCLFQYKKYNYVAASITPLCFFVFLQLTIDNMMREQPAKIALPVLILSSAVVSNTFALCGDTQKLMQHWQW